MACLFPFVERLVLFADTAAFASVPVVSILSSGYVLPHPTRVSFSASGISYLFDPFSEADHYGSAEILFGKFRQSRRVASLGSEPQPSLPLCATKWCIFRASPHPFTRRLVEEAVQERITRTLGDGIDILQIHWQNYNDPGYLSVFRHLVSIKHEGRLRIGALGLVNFDTRRVDEICENVGAGEIISNQVQVCASYVW